MTKSNEHDFINPRLNVMCSLYYSFLLYESSSIRKISDLMIDEIKNNKIKKKNRLLISLKFLFFPIYYFKESCMSFSFKFKKMLSFYPIMIRICLMGERFNQVDNQLTLENMLNLHDKVEFMKLNNLYDLKELY